MFKNILKTTLRSFGKHKGYTIINILGLTVGLVSCFLMLLWVNDEMNIDKFHINDARIYQMKRMMHQDNGQIITTTGIPQPLEILLEETYSEVEKVAIISWDNEFIFQTNDETYKEVGKYASPELFEIFSFPFIIGDPATALNDLHSLVISKNLAHKLFGDDWNAKALGQLVKVDNRKEFKVTGVFENIGVNSSLSFEWIIPAEEYISRNSWVENWGNGGFELVLTLKDGTDVDAFGTKIKNEINNHIEEGNETLFVQKYSDQYLHSNFDNGVQHGGRIDYVKMILIVSIFIIIIASINFVNLATARAANRSREIGVRKVMGAGETSLRLQFMLEALMIVLGSTLLAVLIVQFLLPYFNSLSGKEININYFNGKFWLVTLSIAILTGLMSGLYPAFFLSSFKPLHVITGKPHQRNGMAYFRQGLVIFQFVMSILLIIGTIGVYGQIDFILNKNLGLDRENVVYVDLEGATKAKYESFRTELLRHPNIMQVTSSDQNPLVIGRSTGSARWEGRDPEAQIEISVITVANSFVETMQLELLSGHAFSGNYHQDSVSYLINEKAAGIMGMESPVGKGLIMWGIQGKIIGLVRDFHMTSLHDEIDPLIIRYDPRNTSKAFIRTTGDVALAITQIEKVNKSFNPGFPFSYTFLDQEFEQTYRSEIVIGTLSRYFTGIAIFISCLGLLGLSAHTAQQRIKEIGIRKVMGASIPDLVLLLTTNFGKLVLIAFVIAAPLGYYFTNDWLSQFAYSASMNIWMFVMAAIIIFVIAAITVSFKAIQVAHSNPVDTLKEE